MSLGQEVSLSQANIAKGDEWHDEEVAKDTADGTVEELPSSLRLFRKINYFECSSKGWGKPMNLTMYATYVLIAALVQAKQSIAGDIAGLRVMTYACAGLWYVLALLNSLYAFGSIRQTFAWAGPYRLLLDLSLTNGVLLMLTRSFRGIKIGAMSLEYGLLIVMAGSIYVDQRIVDPAFKNLYYYYHGALNKVEFKEGVPPITGVSNSVLLKIVKASGKALFIPSEAVASILKEIGSMKIRQGEEDALDDWTFVINKLTKVVSFAPSSIKPKSKISATECQSLTAQMILFTRVYKETGKVYEDDAERTAPLTLAEALKDVLKICFQVPLFFIIGIIPRSISSVIMTALLPQFSANLANGILFQNKEQAMGGFIFLVTLLFVMPWFTVLAQYTETLFVKKMMSVTRKKMLRSTLKGGTEFDNKFRPGKLIDSFSSQLTQFELYVHSFFITIVPSIFSIVAGVIVSARAYAPTVYLFISLIPLIGSVSYFEDRSNNASAKKAKADAMTSGKVSSIVQCRDAIRAADAGKWVEEDMEGLLKLTDNTHFASFFRSGLSQSYIDVMSSIYQCLILIPLGLAAINGDIDYGSFILVFGSMQALTSPIYIFGMFSKNTTQVAGAIESVYSLIDDSLNEKPSSKSSGVTSTIKKLSSSLSIKDIKFRYSPRLPDVIKGVNLGLGPGTYSVLMGGSGSGKSTVLNLLMRFREPSEGTVEWDGTDIYSSSLGSFREQVGVMFQRTMIYQGTIRSNILFGQPEVPGAVEKAARDAEISEVIERLPDGYDTVIGGDALAGMSGGQLQRVCMARALYKKPSVLLLDEATSALDAETESSIIKTLVKLRDEDGLTLVSVSHHPSTAVEADKIVVLDHGVIAEEGTYDELMSRGGIFKRMVEAK